MEELYYHIQHYSSITNKYSFQVFGELSSSTEGNVFVSTYSIQLMLLLLALGSKSRTQEQIKSVLGLKTNEVLNFEVMKEVSKIDFPDILTVSNGIFVNDMFSLNNKYTNNSKYYMNTIVKKLPFSKISQETTINEWINISTKGKIGNFFKPGTIDRNTLLLLVSVVHFQNKWEKIFKKNKTEKTSFCLTPTKYIEVEMMQQTNFFQYFKDDKNKFSAVEIPYQDGGYQMLIILPDKMDGLKDLEEIFTKKPKIMVSILENMFLHKVELDIPKFKFESEMSLQNTMEKLNCTDMFTSLANFSGMIDSGSIILSSMVQKTFVAVDEKGTEAAGVTSVSIVNYSGNRNPEKYETVQFNACHPFLFIIKKDKNIIFMGRMSNPTA